MLITGMLNFIYGQYAMSRSVVVIVVTILLHCMQNLFEVETYI